MAEELTITEAPPIKKSRHVSVAINHMVSERNKQLSIRDKAAKEIEYLDAALLALGWPE